MNTPVEHLLSQKGHAVTSVPPNASVHEAVLVMNRFRIGAVVVTTPQKKLLGIFTERDVLNRVVARERDPKITPVHTVMSTQLVTVTPSTTVEDAMRLFSERHVRHLPVVGDDTVVGMISIGDINRHLLEESLHETRHLRGYIHGDVASSV